jgi:drug/metabolite transporter superfamily protein YnfA
MATVLEPTIDRGPAPESSDRSFGFVFAAVFVIIGCWPFWHWLPPRWWALAIAAAFLAVALIRPQILRPLNRVWMAFGRLLHRIVSPLIMGLMFFTVVTPTGWIMRARGKDLLSLRRRPDLSSYWIKREPAQPEAETMKNQF